MLIKGISLENTDYFSSPGHLDMGSFVPGHVMNW